jgi:ribosome-binding factor A
VKKERRERVNRALQRELAHLIATEVSNPHLGFVTVKEVRVTDDLEHAQVFVSIIGDRHRVRQSMDALTSAEGYLRGFLRVVGLRRTPELVFIEDRTTEKAIALGKILAASAAKTEVTGETND